MKDIDKYKKVGTLIAEAKSCLRSGFSKVNWAILKVNREREEAGCDNPPCNDITQGE